MNMHAIRAIYLFEMSRTFRTLLQSIISPVISTALYFIVFGSAIGSRMVAIDGVSYGAFIVPGLIMLTVLMQSVTNASFGIYFPKFIGTIYEPLSAPISYFEMLIGYVGAAATKSMAIGLIILMTSFLFVPLQIAHPFWMLGFLLLTCVSFSLLGFIIGICARNFEQLNLVPALIITPLVFLGEVFILSLCCRPSGRPQPCLIRLSILSPAFAGRFLIHQTWRSATALSQYCCSACYLLPSSGLFLRQATG